MQALATIVLPVFGLMAVGYVASWVRLLPGGAITGLTSYVFNLAIPLLVFRTVSAGSLPDVSPWAYWGAYFLGVAGTWILASLIARFVLGADPLRAGIGGCAGSYSNTVLLGLPLVLTAFGDAGAIPLFLLISVHLPVMMVASILVGEATRQGGGEGYAKLARDTAVAVATNPIIIGIALGLLGRLSGLTLPGAAEKIVNSIADTAVPCALIAMGLTLRRYGIGGDLKLTAVIVTAKLVVHPLPVLMAARLFDLPPVWAGVAALFAAAPSGITSYVVASRYNTAIGAVSSAILIGTGLALFTNAAVLSMVAMP
jgi:malonate transporter and related proteins